MSILAAMTCHVRGMARAGACLCTLVLAGAVAWPASAGVVFREAEIVEAGTGAEAARQVRRIAAQDGQVRVDVEESADPLQPAGAYLLVSASDAVLVDPARAMMAPALPSEMQPVTIETGAAPAPRSFTAVTLQRQFDEPGPTLLGLPTWHYVYLLQYQEDTAGTAGARFEQRHEFWAAPLPQDEPALAPWRGFRLIEDGGAGAARRPIREALAPMYELGFFVRHVIERREVAAGPRGEQALHSERVRREVIAFEREELAAATFEKPSGLAQTEFLAPGPDEVIPPTSLPGELSGDASASRPVQRSE